jgi:hypothetical protein
LTNWKSILCGTCALTLLIPGISFAEYCPREIAAIKGGPLSIKTAPVLSAIYKELGCPVKITFLPGRRGIREFNLSNVDGELFRLPLIEDKYTTTFVRSSEPLITINNAVWSNPDTKIAQSKPLGYTLGIAWQEKFISTRLTDHTVRVLKFGSGEETYDAFNRGLIGSFLAEKQSVQLMLRDKKLDFSPTLQQTVKTQNLYHYLDKKYAKFMADFSKYLRAKTPFSKI